MHVLQPDTSSVDRYNAHCHEVDKAILALKHMTITPELLFAALEYAYCKTSTDSRLVAAHTKLTTNLQLKKKKLTTELVRDTVKARLHLPPSSAATAFPTHTIAGTPCPNCTRCPVHYHRDGQWRPAASTRPGTPRSRSSEQRKALAAVARFNQRLDEMSDTEPSEQEDFDVEDSD